MDGPQTCQCVLSDPCQGEPDPVSGEALLCVHCWEVPWHREANMRPKLLPKRTLSAR